MLYVSKKLRIDDIRNLLLFDYDIKSFIHAIICKAGLGKLITHSTYTIVESRYSINICIDIYSKIYPMYDPNKIPVHVRTWRQYFFVTP